MAVFDPDLQPSSDRGHLLTEQSNRRSSRLDQLDTLALVELFADEDRRPQEAVAAVAPALAQAVDSVVERLRAGGRLFYLGAGTSGRLGVLDAAECPPTFCSEAGYEARLIESGFVPSNDEERLFMAPPQSNRDVSNWKDDAASNDPVSNEAVSDGGVAEQQGVEPALQGLETEPESNPELDELRRRLEGLL